MSKKYDGKYRKRELITIILFVNLIIVRLILTYFSDSYINEYTGLIQRSIEQRLHTECRVVEKMVSIEQLNEFVTIEDAEKPLYKELTEMLNNYAIENDLTYVFFLRMVDGKVQYILDSDPDPETHCGLDYFEEPEEIAIRAFKGESTFNMIGEYVEGWEGLLSAYNPIFNDEGEVVAVVGVDITDEYIVEIREVSRLLGVASTVSTVILILAAFLVLGLFRKKAEDHYNASIAKGQFLSRMSHEIRTPMNAIIGFCQIGKKTKDIEKKEECIDNISNSSEYLLQLINRILDISRMEAGKEMALGREQTSINEIIQNIESIMSAQIQLKNQMLIVDVSPEIPKKLYGDKSRIIQILLNLVSNAQKFTPAGGKISVKVSLIEKEEECCNIEFIVSDNGIGIEEDYISHLFDLFEQGDGGITRKYGGTGMGLATSKRFIEMMSGSISVESKVNEGTTFKFNIWLETADKEDEEEKEPEIVDYKGKTFLLVEDNEINQLVAKGVLEELGAIVEIAHNGEEGVEKFLKEPEKYDMIFMDIQMPIMNGYEATKAIRKSNEKRAKTIPIIAMTAGVYEEDIKNVKDAGMSAYIGKPFKVGEIISIIKKNLEI